MSIVNHYQALGRFTKDPELQETKNGKKVVNFTLAINERYNGEYETTFVDCRAWEKIAESICQYFVKGKPILIQGKICMNTYKDKETDKHRKVVFVLVTNFSFLPKDQKTEEPVRTQRIEQDGFVQEVFGEGYVTTDDSSTAFIDVETDIPF